MTIIILMKEKKNDIFNCLMVRDKIVRGSYCVCRKLKARYVDV